MRHTSSEKFHQFFPTFARPFLGLGLAVSFLFAAFSAKNLSAGKVQYGLHETNQRDKHGGYRSTSQIAFKNSKLFQKNFFFRKLHSLRSTCKILRSIIKIVLLERCYKYTFEFLAVWYREIFRKISKWRPESTYISFRRNRTADSPMKL